MGYDLHITRADFWAENDGNEISADEWLRFVEQDPDLRVDEANGALFAVMERSSGDHPPWFDWSGGNVYTKNPDRRTLAKMLQIAGTLGATVQGDDGETYTAIDGFPGATEASDAAPAGRGWMRENLEYIVVAIAVLAWILFDLFW